MRRDYVQDREADHTGTLREPKREEEQMPDRPLDNAIADHKTYGSVDAQHRLFAGLRRNDPVH
jgi:hypothetical protein